MAPTPDEVKQFERTWTSPPGVYGWFAEVNNQPLGQRFMFTALAFFFVGGVLALLLRLQLAVSDNDFLGPQVYNQLFTMHGSTMMYLFAVPFLEGLALYILPLQIGSRDVAYPRLTAFSYWTYLFGGLIFFSSFIVGQVPDAGWFSYTPLSGPRYSGLGVDFWLLGLSLVELAGITAGIEILVTVLRFRAPGMAVNRIPLLGWAMLVVGTMILFAFTTLLTATVLLELDRTVGTCFFDAEKGGQSLLWQHLFWFFGHPEVYIIFIPATGIVSMIVTTFSGRIIGYTWITVAVIVTGFVSFGLWVHHMYTTGLPELSLHFFAAASLIIALASGTQVFAWIASLWGRRPRIACPLLYVLGFVFIFVLGGMTGVMVAVVPFDWQVHDTYFIVAHFHYVLLGGAVFPVMAGLHYWFPKMTGKLLSETVGQISFALIFVGFNFTFFPMHIMGLLGMARRVYTYDKELGLDGYNLLATLSAFVMAAGFLLFAFNFLLSLKKEKRDAPDSPWNGDSLEWSLSSPPPVYSFYAPPIVTHRHPQWESRINPQPDHGEITTRAVEALTAGPCNFRATLSTNPLDTRPEAVQYLPGPTLIPLVSSFAVSLAFVGVLSGLYILAATAAIFAIGSLFPWLWPQESVLKMLRESDVARKAGLTLFPVGYQSTAWWAMVGFLVVVSTVFGTLFYSYFYIRLYAAAWPQGGISRPEVLLPAIAYGVLLGSALPQLLASISFKNRQKRRVLNALAVAMPAGIAYLLLIGWSLSRLHYSPSDNAYASLIYVLNGAVMMLVPIGIAFDYSLFRLCRSELTETDGFLVRHEQLATMLWHYIAVVGTLVFGVLYISPYVLPG